MVLPKRNKLKNKIIIEMAFYLNNFKSDIFSFDSFTAI